MPVIRVRRLSRGLTYEEIAGGLPCPAGTGSEDFVYPTGNSRLVYVAQRGTAHNLNDYYEIIEGDMPLYMDLINDAVEQMRAIGSAVFYGSVCYQMATMDIQFVRVQDGK